MLLGHTNLSAGTTQVSRYANVGYGMVVYDPVTGSYGLYAQGAHTGIYGLGSEYGVFARSAKIGVYGNGDTPAGVWGNGSSTTPGVRGDSVQGNGVLRTGGGPGNGIFARGTGAAGSGGFFYSDEAYGVLSHTGAANGNYADYFSGNIQVLGQYPGQRGLHSHRRQVGGGQETERDACSDVLPGSG